MCFLVVALASEHVKAAVNLNPKFVQDPIVRSVIHAFVGDYTEAIRDLSEMLSRNAALNTALGRL